MACGNIFRGGCVMKRIISTILSCIIFLSLLNFPVSAADELVWDGSISNSFAGGDGTEENPFLISNAAEFAYFAKVINSGTSAPDEYKKSVGNAFYSFDTDVTRYEMYSGVHFKLMNDIDLNNIEWTPIGVAEYFSMVYSMEMVML